jgi:hypothetical protein
VARDVYAHLQVCCITLAISLSDSQQSVLASVNSAGIFGGGGGGGGPVGAIGNGMYL